MAFVQGRKHLETALEHLEGMITEETRSHQREIRGSAQQATIIGRLAGCTTFDGIAETQKLEIVFHTEHPNNDLDTVIDIIDAEPILEDVSKLKVWITTDGTTFTAGDEYLP